MAGHPNRPSPQSSSSMPKPEPACHRRKSGRPKARLALAYEREARPGICAPPRLRADWLNLAESELGVLTSQCLDRRIPNKQILIDEIAAWEHDRNANHTKADWQFTTK